MKMLIVTFAVVLTMGIFYSRVFAVTPDPIIEYQLGAELQGVYQPKAYANCWVISLGNQNFYIGPFIPDSNTHLTVVRFLSRQSPVGMGRYTKCEAPTSVTAEERAEWLMSRDSSINRNKVRIYYVDGLWDQVTLTVTPSHSPTVTNSPTNTSTLTPSQTPTPLPAPNPTQVFSTGESIDTTQNYAPRKNDICWTWNQYIGRIGDYRIPGGKQALVIKFLVNQPTILVNNVVCENSESRTPEERASWLNNREPWYYPWYKIVTYYASDSMAIVTLTATPTITSTPSVSNTPTVTYTATATSTSTETETPTETETSTATETPTRSRTLTLTKTPTRSSTRTSTPSNTPTSSRTATRTQTPTPTPKLGAAWEVGSNYTTLFIPNKGDICFGKMIGSYKERVIEFSANYRVGIAINGGGCFKTANYSTSEILRYLRSRGINYPLVGLPEPTQSPTRSPVPTATVVGYLPISFETVGNTLFLPIEGTVCWGDSVANLDYKVVRFPRTLKTPVYIKRGACTVGTNLSAEDVFNYLKQRTSVPINGFLDFP